MSRKKIVHFPLLIPDSISFVSKHIYDVMTSESRLPIENGKKETDFMKFYNPVTFQKMKSKNKI